MSEYSDPELDDARVSLNNQRYDGEVDNDDHINGAQQQMQAGEFYPRPRPRYKAAMQEFSKLIKSNFRRDVTLAIDTTDLGPRCFKYLPARTKMEAGINEDLLMPIQKEQSMEFRGVEGIFVPDFTVELSWYQGKEMKM